MVFLARVEVPVRKPTPVEAREEKMIGSNPPKSRPRKLAVSRTAKKKEPIEIASSEAPSPKQAKKGKAKPPVQANKPIKRKAAALESPEEDPRPAKSLVVPFKSNTKKSTPSGLQDDKKIRSSKIAPKKPRSSSISQKQVGSDPESPHSIQYDGKKKVVKQKPVLSSQSAKNKVSSSTPSGKKTEEKLSTSSTNPAKPKKKARTEPEDTRTLKTSIIKKGVKKNAPEDEDSDVTKEEEQPCLPISINGEDYLPPKLGEGTAQRPTKEAMRKEALDRFALRLKLAKSDFLALCRSRGKCPTRKDLEMRAFPKDFQFEPSNKTPSIPPSPVEERRNVSQAEAAYAFRTGKWSPGGTGTENMPKSSSKKMNSTAKTRQSLNKEEPKVRKEPKVREESKVRKEPKVREEPKVRKEPKARKEPKNGGSL